MTTPEGKSSIVTESLKQSPWTWIVSLGLGTVLAYNGATWLMDRSEQNDSFIQTELLSAIKANTASAVAHAAALTAQTVQLQQQTNQLEDMSGAFADWSDALKSTISRLDKLLVSRHLADDEP